MSTFERQLVRFNLGLLVDCVVSAYLCILGVMLSKVRPQTIVWTSSEIHLELLLVHGRGDCLGEVLANDSTTQFSTWWTATEYVLT